MIKKVNHFAYSQVSAALRHVVAGYMSDFKLARTACFSRLSNYLCVSILSVVFALTLLSCQDEITTDGSAQPSFSADTLSLGTLLAGSSSSTYSLMIYNPNSTAIELTSIALREAETSGFRMNVDGMNGTSFTDMQLLRIAAHDSMYVFVEATFDETGQGLMQHQDYIDVACNGRLQTVVLTAESKDVLTLSGTILTENTTFQQGLDIQIYDSLVIAEGVTLTIEDSVTIYLHDKANIIIYGTLLIQGKLAAPVTVRGDRTDKMFENLPYDGLPSQWGGVYLRSTSFGNEWNYVQMRGMTDGIQIESADYTESRLVINSSKLTLSGGNIIFAEYANLTINNSELSCAGGSLLEFYGGIYNFTHCTLAAYNYAASIKKQAVYFSNYYETDTLWSPIEECNFNNCLIWGDAYDPDVIPQYYRITIDEEGNTLDSIFVYRFDHCLIHADGFDDKDFLSCVWNKDPLFRTIDKPNYLFDFRLGEGSPAIQTGSLKYIDTCPTDLNGLPRSTGTAPSIGCYEYSNSYEQ